VTSKQTCAADMSTPSHPFYEKGESTTRKENEAFTTSFYEIDRILQERKEVNAIDEAEDWEEAIRKVLPEAYWNYKHVFSKEESDKLPPRRSYDHRIELMEALVRSIR